MENENELMGNRKRKLPMLKKRRKLKKLTSGNLDVSLFASANLPFSQRPSG